MAQRLSRIVCAAVLLVLAGQFGAAQSPGLPTIPVPPKDFPAPKSSEPAPAGKEQSAPKAGVKDDEKIARIMLKDGYIFLDAGDFEKARFLAKKLKEMNVTFGRDERSADHLLLEIQRQEDNKAPREEKSAPPSFPGGTPGQGFPSFLPPGGMPQPPIQFKFKIDPKASLTDLLPAKPKTPAKLPPWTNEDLAKIPELTFGEPISKKLPKHKAMETTAHAMAKINHLNAKKTDGFMLAMLEQRSDLRGLPFLMGDDCSTRQEQARFFAMAASPCNQLLAIAKINGNGKITVDHFETTLKQLREDNHGRGIPEQIEPAAVAALIQIFMPESAGHRRDLATYLARIPHIDATKALARLAIFSPEDEVRTAAIEGLKTRREKDYTDILMQGFRYPLPAVSKRAAEALVKLERKDLLANLIEVLESPDPRLPTRSAKDGFVVRELVKVNHHRNCLLCHAPGNTDNTPEGVLKVAVPLPGEPLPKPSEGGGYQSTPPPSPDIVVRLDMTYLRQDFSVMMPVSDAHPWPELQRFDFLVRTRELTAAEAKGYVEDAEPGRLSPYYRAALFALRELTGRDTEPTAAAWRKLLKM